MKTAVCSLFVILILSPLMTMAASLREADQAVFQFNPSVARTQYLAVLSDEKIPVPERVEAAHKLAALEFLLTKKESTARALLQQAAALGEKRAETQLVLAEIERKHGDFEASVAAADRALGFAESEAMQYNSILARAKTILARSYAHFRDQNSAIGDDAEIIGILLKIDELLNREPGRSDAAKTSFELSILVGDGRRALAAWRTYYRIPEDGSYSGILKDPGQVLEQILPAWQGSILDRDEADLLIGALADSRFFEAATVVHKLWRSPGESGSREEVILTYAGFLRGISSITQDFYRAHAQGKGDKKGFERNLEAAARELWEQMDKDHELGKFSFDKFRSEISTRFGAEFETQESNGHFGLHFGHRVIDVEHVVEQYGKSVSFRFVSLDAMVSNGYASWFWDGRAQIGGWAGDSRFIQVRPAYLDGGVQALRQVDDPIIRAEKERKIAVLAAEDDSLARETPCVYLPGLVERITHHEFLRIWEKLESSGMEGRALRLSFISEIDRLNLESGIFNHEGRHALDKQDFFNFLRSTEKLEFRAKLSEVAFSEAPFLALCGGILAPNLGDDTSHGKANQKVMAGLLSWMEDNQGEIRGLNRDQPLLPQLDRMTADQLRQACRAMDPDS